MSARDMFALVDYTTDEWGADADYDPDAHGGARDGTTQLFVHQPGYDIREAADAGNVQSEKATLRDIEGSTMGRGWWGLPYDVCVGQSGSIYAGRGLARSGATSGDVDDDGSHNNDEGEAVLVLVAPDTPMTDACRESLTRLLDAFGGGADPDGWLYGHKEAKGTPTACPGDDRMAFIDAYRTATPTPADPEPEPEPEPAPEGSYTVDVTRETIRKQRGWDVKPLTKIAQGLLLAHGADTDGLVDRNGRPDGVFGWGTHRKVEEFQRQHGLKVDGIVGPVTWDALENGA